MLIGFALMTCLVAPVAEEFFFRGFLFRTLHEKISAVPAVLVTGLCFGLVHLPSGDWIGTIVLSLFGMGLCVLLLCNVVVASVHHVARFPQLDLVRLHEGAALVGIPAAYRRERHDDARHLPAGHTRRSSPRAVAGVAALAVALVLPAAASAQVPPATDAGADPDAGPGARCRSRAR